MTNLDFVQELETVTTLLGEGAERTALVEAANVQPHIERIGALVQRFRGEVGAGQAAAIGFDQVRSARSAGQRNLQRPTAG